MLLWFGIDRAMVALGYVIIGMIIREVRIQTPAYLQFALFAITLALWIYEIFTNSLCSMYGATYGNYMLFVIGGLSGSYLFLSICKLLNRMPYIEYLSQHSIFIIGSHYLFVWLFNDYLVKLVNIESRCLYTYCYLSVILIIYKQVCSVIKLYIPVLDGNKK